MGLTGRKEYHQRLTNMLPGFGNAKNLTFDLDSIEALNEISNLLVNLPSPFYKLKYVMVPLGSKESCISSALRSYLLGSSPKATIITKLPQIHGVEDLMVDADRVRHIDASVEGTDKDQTSSLRGERDFRLWRSHVRISMTDVDSQMIVAYRDIFSYLQNQGFNISWMVNRLNYIEHLRFSKPLIDELQSIDSHMDDAKTKLQELQARADDARIQLQDLLGRVDDAKLKLQDVQTLRVEKLTAIEKAFGTMGTNLAVGFIGDDLLS
ncbi:hypothetical protein POM88_002577 [Heracleum sosnowskyi]|uniref:Uncharacterized protein n=1 Tax=Heracleum sosnowskyi TaxID=360622 RepID=A0AAD8JI76_9APIA|nr:hypothetical protein POM88_002577 [Heracleum sosnowskyi]